MLIKIMGLSAIKHPQKDFFILDISDVVLKDDMASMEHPLFSLATKPDLRHLIYKNNDNVLEIIPSSLGLPSIKDKDILIFCISQLVHLKNSGENVGKRVRFSARELMIATNRNTDGREYKRLEKSFQRLQGTQFKTNIKTGNKKEVRIFSLIDEGGYVMKNEGKWRLDYCEVVLSDWLLRAINANEIVSISEDYFRIRRPLERRIYEIARKHCGNQKRWHIDLAKLQMKTGSNAPLKKFRLNIRQVIEENTLPFYHVELNENDLVIFRPRAENNALSSWISLPEWAEDKARKIALEKGLDYYALRANWQRFAEAETQKGNPPKDTGAAFISYCKKQDKTR